MIYRDFMCASNVRIILKKGLHIFRRFLNLFFFYFVYLKRMYTHFRQQKDIYPQANKYFVYNVSVGTEPALY